jgi:hypothetical protein
LLGHRYKGKIPKSEWETIATRRTSGEPFASIARDYGCTAPAIRYIVGRTSDRGEGGTRRRERARLRHAPDMLPRPAKRDELARSETSVQPPLLTPELSARIIGDIVQFLVAVDTASASSSPEMVAKLRSATDQIMRSAARLLLEIERRGA